MKKMGRHSHLELALGEALIYPVHCTATGTIAEKVVG